MYCMYLKPYPESLSILDARPGSEYAPVKNCV